PVMSSAYFLFFTRPHSSSSFFFSFTAPAPTALYTLSLHDALPISPLRRGPGQRRARGRHAGNPPDSTRWSQRAGRTSGRCPRTRSEEHTSELQSRFDLVCRLLLEKKKKKNKEDTERIDTRLDIEAT